MNTVAFTFDAIGLPSELRSFILLHLVRIIQIVFCAGVIGASVSGLLLHSFATAQINSFNLESQVAQHNVKIAELDINMAQQKLAGVIYEREIATLVSTQKEQNQIINNLRDEVSVMHGIGIAVGAVLMILTFLQLWFSRLVKPIESNQPRLIIHREKDDQE